MRISMMCACVLGTAASVSAALPIQTSHSGLLLDSNDQPLSRDGVALGFSVWSSATAGDASARVFPASGTSTCVTNVRNGRYAVTLGSAACGQGLDTAHLPPHADRWLEIVVDGVTLSPRVLLSAAPTATVASLALDAQLLDGVPRSGFATATHGHSASEITGLGAAAVGAVTNSGLPWSSITGLSAASEWPGTIPLGRVDGMSPTSEWVGTQPFARVTGVTTVTDWPGSVPFGRVGGITANTPWPGTATYIANGTTAQAGSFNITGTATVGGAADIGGALTVRGTHVSLPVRTSEPFTCGGGSNKGALYFDDTLSLMRICTATGWRSATVVPRGTASNPALSCRAILDAGDSTGNGVYWLRPSAADAAFEAYCDMTGGGWTLVLMTRSDDFETLRYDSAYWSNTATLNPATTAPATDANMKNAGYSTIPVSEMRFDLISMGNARTVTVSGTSARAILSGGYVSTSYSRGDYLGWINDVASSNWDNQLYCNVQGIQSSVSGANCRFGILMNNENDCSSNDSAIGFGCHTNNHYTGRYTSAGGHRWNSDVRYSRRGWIFVR